LAESFRKISVRGIGIGYAQHIYQVFLCRFPFASAAISDGVEPGEQLVENRITKRCCGSAFIWNAARAKVLVDEMPMEGPNPWRAALEVQKSLKVR